MVQPVASTSTCACIVDPIVNSGPYQLISGACSAVVSLAQRIINFVSSIFAVIANFVRSCFCMASAAIPPAAPAAAATTPAALPRAAPLAGPAPVAPAIVDVVVEGKTFLAHLVQEFEHNFAEGELHELMRNEAAAKAFLANLLAFALVIAPESFEDMQLPFMVTQEMRNLAPLTFISCAEELRPRFAALDPVPEADASGSDDSSIGLGSSVEEAPIGEAVRQHFINRHLQNCLQDDRDRDLFDEGPRAIGSDANIFYAELNALAARIGNRFINPTFAAAAEATRAEYILINA